MTDIANLSNVAYKKGSWMRYTLWGIGAVSIAALLIGFITLISKDTSSVSAPEGYRFSVVDNYIEGSKITTTYYIYDDNRIIVKDESFIDGKPNSTMMIYDGISTTSLKYDESDVTEICELGACVEKPKILAVVKKLISSKIGREYIGL